jgi:hypothetical protein
MRHEYHDSVSHLVEAEVFGSPTEWEKHEIGGGCTFVKPIHAQDPAIKATIAKRYDEMGFVPAFFRERGKDFVALEAVKKAAAYKTVEEAFTSQILGKQQT